MHRSAREGLLEMGPDNGDATIHGNLTVRGQVSSAVLSKHEVKIMDKMAAQEEIP